MTTTAEPIYETRGIVESQPVMATCSSSNSSTAALRMPGDGSDSCTLLNSALEAGSGGPVVTGLPPSGTLKRSKQRRIEVDYSLLNDDDTFSQASTSRGPADSSSSRSGNAGGGGVVTKENDQNVHNVVPLRRRELTPCLSITTIISPYFPFSD